MHAVTLRWQAILIILFGIPVLAAGQGIGGGMGGVGGGRHGGGRRSRGDSTSGRDPAAARADMERRGFAGLLLDHRAAFQLTDSQVVVLTSLQSEFQAQTANMTHQLDSLRAANTLTVQGVAANHDSLTMAQRDTVVRRRDLIAEDLARIRDSQQQSRQRALALLTPVQQQQAIVLEEQAERGGDNNARSSSGIHGGHGRG